MLHIQLSLLSNLYNVGLRLLCIKIKMLLTVVGLFVKFLIALKKENLCVLSLTQKQSSLMEKILMA